MDKTVSAQDFFGSAAPTPAISSTTTAVSASDFFGSSAPVLVSSQTPTIEQQPAKQSIFGSIGSSVKSQFLSGVNQIKQGVSNIFSGNSSPLQGAESGLGIEAGLATAVTSPLAPLLKPIGSGINALASGYTAKNGQHVGGIGDIPLVQKFAATKTGKITARAAEDFSNAGTIAGTILGTSEAPKISDITKENNPAIGRTADTLTALNTLKDKATSSLENRYVDQAKSDFAKPTTINAPGFNKATQIFKNAIKSGNDIPQILVDNGITLKKITQDGKYNTSDVADMLRNDTGQLSKDLLRPSLQQSNYSTARIPVENIIKQAKENISKDNSIIAEQKSTLNSKLNAVQNALQKQYPDGLNLTDLHDEKILRAQNAKFSPIGDVSTNLEAIKNRELSSVLKKAVEDTAPSNIPVKEFNSELQKRYQAADYLDSLNGKKIPTSLGQRIAQQTAKIAGAIIGEKITGGGILGSVGGYHLGGLLEKYIQNMAAPLKNYFLDNLERNNPSVFEKIKSTLNENDLANAIRPKLPSPEPLGTSKNPIITPAPTTFEAPAEKINNELLKPAKQLLLPPKTTEALGEPIYLPKSAREINMGTNEIKNAKIRNTLDRRRLIK